VLSCFVELAGILGVEDEAEGSARRFVEWRWEAYAGEADCREVLSVLEIGGFDEGGEA
jgi:hypothetical protein